LEVTEGDSIHLSVFAKYERKRRRFSKASLLPSGAAEKLVSDIGTMTMAGGANPVTLLQIADLIASDLQKKETPEAYMGYALYDSDSNLYEKGKILLSSQAENKHEKLNHAFLIEKGGFMETFLVNETSQDVFFDNFRIQSTPSITVQVTHYYPFGMEMPALSYQAPAMNKNRYLYNQGTGEVTFDTERIPDLNIDLTKFRAYDPALGRWWQIDPMADALTSWTPYNYGFNSPIMFNDPLGDCPPGTTDCNGDTEQRKEQDQARTQGQTADFFARNSGRQSGGGGIMKYVSQTPSTASKPAGNRDKKEDVSSAAGNGNKKDTSSNLIEKVWNHPLVRAYTGDAVTLEFDLSVFIKGGSSVKPIGFLVPLRGQDRFNVFTTSDAGVGLGLDVSTTGNFGRLWYLGNVKDIEASLFSGLRYELNASASGGLDYGGSVSYAPTKTGYGVVGSSTNIGFGVPLPLPISGNFNVGYTSVWGKIMGDK
jgi:RHS repeat-associated protein